MHNDESNMYHLKLFNCFIFSHSRIGEEKSIGIGRKITVASRPFLIHFKTKQTQFAWFYSHTFLSQSRVNRLCLFNFFETTSSNFRSRTESTPLASRPVSNLKFYQNLGMIHFRRAASNLQQLKHQKNDNFCMKKYLKPSLVILSSELFFLGQ